MRTDSSQPIVLANRYMIGEQVGAGGMGEVYKAVDNQTGALVALKCLKPAVEESRSDMVARFLREAEALRQLNHPNIVRIHDQFEDAGLHCLVMEYVSGGSLDAVLNEARNRGELLPLGRILAIALEIADALTRAHHLRIIHRDLKPANVLCAPDGTIRLTDFGIAWLETNGEPLTESGTIMGTADFISPELLNGQQADQRSDIWAFGILLYELLTLTRPFRMANWAGLVKAILMQPIPDLEVLRADLPVALSDLIYRLLERDPQRRIPSMRLVGASLESILAQLDGSAEDTPTAYSSMSVFSSLDNTPQTAIIPHNLPLAVTPFIGREAEQAAVLNLLATTGNRIVTITGIGGAGKTRLSLEVARHLVEAPPLDWIPDGIYFIELAPISSIDRLISTIAETLRYNFQDDKRTYKQQVLDELRSRRALFVLDNFEHIMEASSLIADILAIAPDIKLLITSRERLNFQEELVFRLTGMDFTDEAEALETSAVRLFLQSARYALPGFELQAGDLSRVLEICRLVEGLPLGIILAAGWVGMLSLPEIVTEIRQTLDFLESEARNLPDRHHSLRAVFEYSWTLMTEAERDSLIRLSVFRGGFTREAAQSVASASIKTLLALVNKSLLSRDPASGRYTCHSLMRQFAEEKLESSAQASAAHDAHCEYFLNFMYEHRIDLDRKDSRTFDQFEADMENIRVAWSYAMDMKRFAAIQRAMTGLISRNGP